MTRCEQSWGTTALYGVMIAALTVGPATAQVLHREPLFGPLPPVESPVEPAEAVVPPPVTVPTPEVRTPAGVEPELPTLQITDLDLGEVVDIVTLLRLMARLADMNMLISPEIEGTIGFTFYGVPWDEAFRSVIATAGLTTAWQGDVLRVMTMADVRRGLELETLLKDREGVREELRRVEPMVLRVIPLRYLLAENVETTVSRILSADTESVREAVSGRRQATVSADTESNAIVVHAVRDDVAKAVALIEELDRPRPLIQIEAWIVEATRDTARQLGMQWGAEAARRRGTRIVSTAGGPGGFMSDFPAQFVSGTEMTPGLSLGVVSDRVRMNELLNMQLTALQRQRRINIQSSPVVTTLDNETAVIESGEERAYRVSSGTGNVLDVSLEWKKAVLKLEVTPHVIDGSTLRVRIISHKDSFDETKPQTNNEFTVNTKRTQTTVLLADGDTAMIGSFSIDSSSDAVTGIPGLMRLPLIGRLFRSKSSAGRFDETLIFITPTIL